MGVVPDLGLSGQFYILLRSPAPCTRTALPLRPQRALLLMVSSPPCGQPLHPQSGDHRDPTEAETEDPPVVGVPHPQPPRRDGTLHASSWCCGSWPEGESDPGVTKPAGTPPSFSSL